MSFGPKNDDLVQSVTLYQRRPLFLHAYISPFIFLYSTLAYHWPANENTGFELWYVAAGLLAFVHLLTVLSSQWSVHVLCLFAYSKQTDVETALYVKVVPTANNGSCELKLLNRQKEVTVENGSESSQTMIWFDFQKTRYIYNRVKGHFETLAYPTDRTFLSYLQTRGLDRDEVLKSAEQRFGPNDLKMDIPDFMELFKERALAPFFVFQVFCMCLWCLDDYWYYSLFTLAMLVMFECSLVMQQRQNLKEVRRMGQRTHHQLQVYRNRKWVALPSHELFPGDLVALGRSPSDHTLPCDLLLLRGRLIADEALLTGESVPQAKEPLDQLCISQPNLAKERRLDLTTDGKLHVLFGGTRVLQHTPPGETEIVQINESDESNKSEISFNLPKPPNNLCLAYVLQTGFSTSQGKLLRTILFGVKQITANSLETFAFVLFLLMFALASAGYLWVEGSKNPNRSRHKLMLECVLIIVSVLPPELPIELSLAVTASLLSLSKRYIFCTEPFRIPFGGKVEFCCFDKTGTLTTDQLRLDGVVTTFGSQTPLPDTSNGETKPVKRTEKALSKDAKDKTKKSSNKEINKMSSPSDLSMECIHVLASCQSLVQLDERLIGDPLEKATLDAIEWAPGRNDVVSAKKGRIPSVKVLQRFHFSSALKRMSVVASWVKPDINQTQYFVAVKGAPEVIRKMLKQVPHDYDQLYQNIARQGGRVIALARRSLTTVDSQKLKQFKREDVETDLDFVGFAVYSCPLKKDTKKVIQEIIDSSHIVVMITGDAPLTACHVASELRMFSNRKTPLILTCVADQSSISTADQNEFVWQVLDENRSLPLQPPNLSSFLSTFDFCVTGEGLAYLHQKHPKLFRELLPYVRVWARVAPKQKELIVTSLRDFGYHTLMCGDGTNDVGALKHAHVGIALISNAPLTAAKPSTAVSAANRLARSQIPPSNQIRTGNQNQNRNQAYAENLRKMMEELEKQENTMVKLGDASVAAPFTSRLGSIACVCDVIKQGRCTLVTTLQMFKILALNSLILAYCQSALYLDGVKLSDSQATLQGLLLAGCFLFISRSKPVETLSKERSLPNIFNAYSILTVTSQFAVHFASLLYLVQQAKLRSPASTEEFVDLEAEFKPSLVNSTVYVISMWLQVCTFAVNYHGLPFMQSLYDNKSLFYSISGSFAVLLAIVSGLAPDLADQFSIVPFESEFQRILLSVLFGDFAVAFLTDRFWRRLLGEGSLPRPLLL